MRWDVLREIKKSKDPESADPSYVCAEKKWNFGGVFFVHLFMGVLGWWWGGGKWGLLFFNSKRRERERERERERVCVSVMFVSNFLCFVWTCSVFYFSNFFLFIRVFVEREREGTIHNGNILFSLGIFTQVHEKSTRTHSKSLYSEPYCRWT